MPGEVVLEQVYESVAIDTLTQHPDNPRRGDVDVILRSIQATGFFGALVVHRPTRHILVGNHRWQAAGRSGLTHLPVLFVDCDDRRAKQILLADNRIAELAEWDDKALLALLTELEGNGTELDTLGFTEADLAALVAQPHSDGSVLASLNLDVGPPVHQVHHGQVWKLERHTLAVASVFTDWPLWLPYLAPGALLVPYPSPYAPLSAAAADADLVLVQPELHLAGHLLDKWTAVHGEPVLASS